MIIELTANRLARWIKNNDSDNSRSIEVVEYFLLLRLNFWSVIVIGSIIGICFNRVPEMALAMSAFWLIRVLSGGYHFSSMTQCCIATVSILSAAAFIEMDSNGIVICTLISLVLNVALSTRHLNLPPLQKRCYYTASIWMVGSNLLMGSSVIALCFLAQSILLTIRRR